MKRKALAVSVSAGIALLAAGGVQAETSVSFSGFGTLGVTHNDNRDADFVANRFQPNGPGKSSPTMFGVDTKAGVQFTAQIGSDLSAVVQAVTDHRVDNSYAPRFEWANLKYQVTKDLYVRAGRVVAPVFMVSDFRNVGYAQTMVRMPVEVYGQNPVSYLDGIDLGYRMGIGDGTLSVQATSGLVKTLAQQGLEVSGHGSLLSLAYERDASTFRFGYFRNKVKIEGDPVDQFLLPFRYASFINYTGAVPIADGLRSRLLDLGYSYDSGNWLAQAEYIQSRVGGIPDSNAGYLMGGYRVGKFTPYLSYAKSVSKRPPRDQQAVASCTNCLTELLAYGINVVNASSHMVLNEQQTVSLGVRYDVAKNVALKMQLDHIRKPGSLTSPNAGWFKVGTPSYPDLYPLAATKDINANLLTLTADFVF